jgi:hypothetical protein
MVTVARWGFDLTEPHRWVPEPRHVKSVPPAKKKPPRWSTLKLSRRERRAA